MKTLGQYLKENKSVLHEGNYDYKSYETFVNWVKKHDKIFKAVNKILADVEKGKYKPRRNPYDVDVGSLVNKNGWYVSFTSGSLNYNKDFRDKYTIHVEHYLGKLVHKKFDEEVDEFLVVKIDFENEKVKGVEVEFRWG